MKRRLSMRGKIQKWGTADMREKFVVNAKGRKVAVILPLSRYRQLLEDLHDLAAVAERGSEPSISIDKMKQAKGFLKGIDTSLESERGHR